MTVRDLLETLLSYVMDGRGSDDEVLIDCGGTRVIESVETRLIRDGDDKPKETFILIVANGPSDVSEITPTTLRPTQG